MSEVEQIIKGSTVISRMAFDVFMSFPAIILLIHNDEDAQQLVELYQQYKRLMFKVAQQYFHSDQYEMEDAISDAIIRVMNNFTTIRTLPCNKTASYIVKIVRSVCNDRLRKLSRQRSELCRSDIEDNLEEVEDVSASNEIVFSRFFAIDLLHSFEQLNEREKQLIRLRHIDGLDYEDITLILGIKETTARTAVSRALRHLEELAKAIDKDDLM